MKLTLCALLILFTSPMLANCQTPETSIQTEGELVAALCSKESDQRTSESLLKSYPQFINSDLWTQVSKEAAVAYYGQSPERSIAIYKVAIQVADQLHDLKLLGATYYSIGRTYSGLNKFADAIDSYEKSRAYFERAGLTAGLANVLADLGALYLIQENYSKAKDYSEQSLSSTQNLTPNSTNDTSADVPARARALLTLGEIDSRDGNHTQALEKLKESLALYQRLSRESPSYAYYVAGAYGAIGRVYPDVGDYAQALSYFSKGLEIAKAGSYSNLLSSFRNDIGVLYLEQEDYEQAKAQFVEGIKICESDKNQNQEVRLLLNLGVVEQRRGNLEKALRYFRLSLQMAEAIAMLDFQIAGWEGIGVVLTARRDFVGAIDALNKGVAIARRISDKTRQTELLWRMAQTRYEMRSYPEASALAESAVVMARSSHLAKLTYLATTTLGESFVQQQKYDLALKTLTEAVRQLESLREQVAGSELETELFLENKVASYDALVDLLIREGKTVDALLCADRSKGRVLLDVLEGGKLDSARLLTLAERAEAQQLNRRISEINDAIRKEGSADTQSLNSLYTQLDAARVQYQAFQDSTYVSHPELKLRSGQTAPLTPADINNLGALSDTAFLEYVVAKDSVFLFVLRNKSGGVPEVKAYSVNISPNDLMHKVNDFHEAVAGQRLSYANQARELYLLLIAPAEEQLRNVDSICIIPDAVLWNLPFQALMNPNERFLIEDHSVYYAPSLSVLREIDRKHSSNASARPSLIAFGNPVIGNDEQRNTELCPLPEAEQEVSSIAKFFVSETPKVLIGRYATEKAFKSLAQNYSVIHLATHGVIDNKYPLYSHLLLTKTDGDLENDGRLEARQIMNLNLPADLAVLSACETANGRIAPGEGVMGLSWAFFVAGTRATLVSQWKISSDSTTELMNSFYKNLNSNPSVFDHRSPRALRDAALTMIHGRRYSHPFYWAGFVLIGS